MTSPTFVHAQFRGYSERDVAGVVEQQLSVVQRRDDVRQVEARVDRLTELLGHALLLMTPQQQLDFVAAAAPNWKPVK